MLVDQGGEPGPKRRGNARAGQRHASSAIGEDIDAISHEGHVWCVPHQGGALIRRHIDPLLPGRDPIQRADPSATERPSRLRDPALPGARDQVGAAHHRNEWVVGRLHHQIGVGTLVARGDEEALALGGELLKDLLSVDVDSKPQEQLSWLARLSVAIRFRIWLIVAVLAVAAPSYTSTASNPGAIDIAISMSKATSSFALPGRRPPGEPSKPSISTFCSGTFVSPARVAYPEISVA